MSLANKAKIIYYFPKEKGKKEKSLFCLHFHCVKNPGWQLFFFSISKMQFHYLMVSTVLVRRSTVDICCYFETNKAHIYLYGFLPSHTPPATFKIFSSLTLTNFTIMCLNFIFCVFILLLFFVFTHRPGVCGLISFITFGIFIAIISLNTDSITNSCFSFYLFIIEVEMVYNIM